jgi:hypothetical protein
VNIGEMRNAYNILVEKSEGKIPFRIPRCSWEDNIRTDLMEIGWEVVDWMHLTQDKDHWLALMGFVMNFQVP